jgi:hypothetical protein
MRVTPYDMVFGTAEFEGERFPAIAEEAQTRGFDLLDPERFVMLGETGVLIRQILGDDDAGEAVSQLGALLYHAFHFSRTGKLVLELTEADARALVEAAPDDNTPFAPPSAAGYIQLPRNLFWSRIDPAAPAESVDGFFWVWREIQAPQLARLQLLLVLGLRADRAGLSLIDIGEDVPGTLAAWAQMQAREDGEDFANVLPGGEIQKLLAITTPLEALKLAALCFRHLATQAETKHG